MTWSKARDLTMTEDTANLIVAARWSLVWMPRSKQRYYGNDMAIDDLARALAIQPSCPSDFFSLAWTILVSGPCDVKRARNAKSSCLL